MRLRLRTLFVRLAPAIALLAWLASAPSRSVTTPRPEGVEADEAGAYPADYFYIQRAMADGSLPSERIDAAAEQMRFELALAAKSGGAFASAQDWVAVGPYNIGGRVNTVVAALGGVPAYLGSANGGVFRSDDFGTNWLPLTDALGIHSVGSLALNPLNSNSLWLGSGDANATLDGYDGNGIYVSRDRGMNWTHMGLRTTSRIADVELSPLDSNRIYVAAMGKAFTTDSNRGLYRSLDGGLTWTRTLFVNDSTGVSDIASNPLHPDTMYCTTWTRVRRLTYRRAFGADCGIWRSIDAGATWTRLLNGLPPPGENTGRIAIAVAPSQPSTIYASTTTGSIGGYLGSGLYRSDDAGDSWTRVDLGSDHRNAFGGFAWYFGRVVVSPIDPDDVWVLGVSLLHSIDGGVTLNNETGVAHVDQHGLWIDPTTPTRVYLGNDGGFWSQVGGPWQKSPNLPITQFYAGSVDPGNANKILGGTQDNGTVKTESGVFAWAEILGADGFQSMVNPGNTNILLGEWQYACDRAGIRRSVNNGLSWVVTSGWAFGDRYNWNTPFTANPRNPNTLIAGTQRAYKSTNGALNWAAVSADLTTNPGTAVVYGTISTVAISNADTLLYLAGTDDGRVWRSQSAGTTWQDISAGLPGRYVTVVAADPNAANVIYVAHSGFGQDLHDPRVFRSANRGDFWQEISGNLPDAPVNDLIVDPVLTNTLYAATDLGVFVTRNLGGTWTPLGGAMPIQPVWDLVLHAGTRQLFAFTHGRSAWKLDLATVPLSVPGARATSGLELAAPAPNPTRTHATLVLSLAARAQVGVDVFDAAGREVRGLVRGALDPGRHSLVWDTRDARGSRVRAGVYFVRASDGAATRTQRIVVTE